MGHFVSATCQGEKCRVCGAPAHHKVSEEIPGDDPGPARHNLTAYVCCAHFIEIMGPAAASTCLVEAVSCKHSALSPLPKAVKVYIDPGEDAVNRYWCADCGSVITIPKDQRPSDCPGRHLGALTTPPEKRGKR